MDNIKFWGHIQLIKNKYEGGVRWGKLTWGLVNVIYMGTLVAADFGGIQTITDYHQSWGPGSLSTCGKYCFCFPSFYI